MEIISFTTPKARKDHTCDWCDEKKKEVKIIPDLFVKKMMFMFGEIIFIVKK